MLTKKTSKNGQPTNPADKLEHWPIERCIGYARNPRKNDHAVDKMAAAIREFGFRVPMLAKSDGTVVDGHLRLKAARKLGMNTIPVLLADDMTDIQIKAFRLSVNKMADLADWDDELLALEFADLDAEGFDLALTGFDPDEIARYMTTATEGLTDPDDVPEAPKVPVTKLGDVWLMGSHRLLCGSSTDEHSVKALLADQMPNTMITDPPYGVKYEAGWRAKAAGRIASARETNSNMMNDDQCDWYDAYVLFPGTVAYVWHASANADVVMNGLRRAGFEIKQQIIWNKNALVLGRSDYQWKHEPCWYATKPNGDRNWKGGRTQTTVWDIKSVRHEEYKTAHPTQKPVEIYVRGLQHHTNQGEYVYEPFGGSGTAIIACEKLGRRSLSMELDPKYCDIIVKRWQDFTGQSATLESTGKTYAQLEEENDG